jgi:hypothetical protein
MGTFHKRVEKQQQAASVRIAARLFGIGRVHLTKAIACGAVTPRVVGRRSICDFQQIREWLHSQPITPSSKRKIMP